MTTLTVISSLTALVLDRFSYSHQYPGESKGPSALSRAHSVCNPLERRKKKIYEQLTVVFLWQRKW